MLTFAPNFNLSWSSFRFDSFASSFSSSSFSFSSSSKASSNIPLNQLNTEKVIDENVAYHFVILSITIG